MTTSSNPAAELRAAAEYLRQRADQCDADAKTRPPEDRPEVLEALRIAKQALLEVAAAQERGANWYTHGADGLWAIINRWTREGLDAINKATAPYADKQIDTNARRRRLHNELKPHY